MIKLLKKYLWPYKWQVLLVLIFVGLQVAGELGLPTVTAKIVDVGLVNGDIPYILKNGVLMLLLSLGQVCAMLCIGFLSSRVSSGMGRDLRHSLFVKAESLSLQEMNKLGVSSMIVRSTTDVTTLQSFSVMLMRMVLTAPVMLIGSIILTLNINKQLSKVILVSVPLLVALFIGIIVSASKLMALHRKKVDKLNVLLREHLSGTRVIRAFVNQKTEQDKFDLGNSELYEISLKIGRIVSSMIPSMMLIVNLTTVAVCYFGSFQVHSGTMMVGQLISFVQYVTQILMSLAMLSMLMVIAPRANVSAARINEVLNTQTTITEPENAIVSSDHSGTVEYRNVSFSYPGSDTPVISNVSFVAEGGKTTAFVGSTGCGKTTILNLLPRLYDVTSGEILLDGQNVKDYSINTLRERIGFVPQKGVLFTGSIADNIRFGKKDASDEEVISALKTAQAWDFVSSKEKGIEEQISQGGKNVSGGQKQRLSIARAIVKDAEVYVFDDSFSALDFATDAKLRNALAKDKKIGKKTRIIVAQRISTVMNADKIIVLEKGKVVGEGKHKDLLKNCPLYYEIASSQLSEEELQ